MNVYGYSEDGKRALVVGDDDQCRVFSVASDGRISNGGRWECSVAHLRAHEEVYRARFPNWRAFGIAAAAPIIAARETTEVNRNTQRLIYETEHDYAQRLIREHRGSTVGEV